MPVVGGAIETLLGPGLVVAGIGAIAKGVIDLGAGNLTPFAAPVEGNELKTTGAFSYVRHPIYGGLLVAATGLGVATESFQRLLVVFLLYLLLDAKSAYEEKELERIHPAYRAYKQVTPKFFPSSTSRRDPGLMPCGARRLRRFCKSPHAGHGLCA